jgi:hypothetical protein
VERWECLECSVGGTVLMVPVRTLERVAEYALLPPPPLSEPWVGGLGQIDDRVFVSIALPGRAKSARSRKGLLLRGGADDFCALEVERTGRLLAVEPGETVVHSPWACPPHWIRRGAASGEAHLCLDLDAFWNGLFSRGEAA